MDLISSKKLRERWGVGRSRLFEFLKDGAFFCLYDKHGKVLNPAEVFIEITGEPSPFEGLVELMDIELPEEEDEREQYLFLFSQKVHFDLDEIKILERFLPDKSLPAHKYPAFKGQRKHDRRKEDMRRAQHLAEKYWEAGLELNRPDMARKIQDKVRKKNGDKYSERTIKKWIREVDPNPPLNGRPKKN